MSRLLNRFGFVVLLIGSMFTSAVTRAAIVSDLEDVVLPPEGFLNAVNGAPATRFNSGSALYPWSTFFGFPIEFAASNISDINDYLNDGDNLTFPSDHPYNSITGGGSGPSLQYAVANALEPVTIDLPGSPISIDVTNTTYTYYSMQSGDGFGKKFGGASGNDADFFLLTITGKNNGATIGSVEVYLADFRSSNNALDFILDQWITVDVSSLVGSNRLQFSLTSSDTGGFGMNTPAYFAVDNLLMVPEPTSAILAAIGMGTLLRWRRRRGIHSEHRANRC